MTYLDHVREFGGQYKNEKDALEDLDRRLSDLFYIYREVEGYYIANRPGKERRDPRIDRILVPGPRLKAAGWHTTIGVEAKRSGVKFGPAVAQAIDYTWGIFRCGRTYLYPEWIFLWPASKHEDDIYGPIESVMLQNRIGWAFPGRSGGGMTFHVGAGHALSIGATGEFQSWPERIVGVGLKTGAR